MADTALVLITGWSPHCRDVLLNLRRAKYWSLSTILLRNGAHLCHIHDTCPRSLIGPSSPRSDLLHVSILPARIHPSTCSDRLTPNGTTRLMLVMNVVHLVFSVEAVRTHTPYHTLRPFRTHASWTTLRFSAPATTASSSPLRVRTSIFSTQPVK